MLPWVKIFKIGLGNAISFIPSKSSAINSYVYFVELFSESRFSWFPSRSTKIHDRFVNLLNVCNYDSWFRIRLPPPFWNVFFGHYSVVKIFPYEYFDSFDKFLGTKLSNEFAFFSFLKVMAFINRIMIMHKLYLKIFNVNHWETTMIFIWKQMCFSKLCLSIFQESVSIIVNSTLHILHESDFELDRLTV